MLDRLVKRYRQDLDESVVPFWLNHSLDRQHGGYFSCLDREGRVYDDRKYLWLQGRAVWMFSRLYNEWSHREEFLDAATLGADFIRRHGRDRQGRVFFSLTRDGRPLAYQRKPYAAVFIMLGLLEYSRATGDRACRKEAEALFWRIVGWIAKPETTGRQRPPAGGPAVSGLANEMVLMGMAMELLRDNPDARVRRVFDLAVRQALLHYDADRRVLLELVALDGSDLRGSPDGRLFNPGHSIEVGWFLLHAAEFLAARDRSRVRAVALDAIEGSLELGWDRKFGGLLYLMDIEGHPPLQLEHFMKLWWPHTEAIYALVLAHVQTREARWLRWLEKVHAYAYRHFADPKFGEWFGYCDRQGNLTHTCKGGNYKGFFHVPRALLFSVQRAEAMKEERRSSLRARRPPDSPVRST